MKKSVFVLLILFVLVGCSNANINEDKLSKIINKTIISKSTQNKNYFKKYYSFYVDQSVNVRKSGNLYNVLEYNRNELVLNINVKGIINAKYYPDVDNLSLDSYDGIKPYYQYDGEYLDAKENKNKFRILIYNNDENYLISVLSNEVIITSICQEGDIEMMMEKMMFCLKGVEVKKELVLDHYTLKSTIINKKKELDLFKVSVPASGRLEDVIEKQDDIQVQTLE